LSFLSSRESGFLRLLQRAICLICGCLIHCLKLSVFAKARAITL